MARFRLLGTAIRLLKKKLRLLKNLLQYGFDAILFDFHRDLFEVALILITHFFFSRCPVIEAAPGETTLLRVAILGNITDSIKSSQ